MKDKLYGRRLLPDEVVQEEDLIYRTDGSYALRAKEVAGWVGKLAGQHAEHPIHRLTPNEEFFRTYERGSAV